MKGTRSFEKVGYRQIVQADSLSRSNNIFWRSNDNAGQTGDWKNHFSPELNSRIDEWIEKNLAGTDLKFVTQLDWAYSIDFLYQKFLFWYPIPFYILLVSGFNLHEKIFYLKFVKFHISWMTISFTPLPYGCSIQQMWI